MRCDGDAVVVSHNTENVHQSAMTPDLRLRASDFQPQLHVLCTATRVRHATARFERSAGMVVRVLGSYAMALALARVRASVEFIEQYGRGLHEI